MSELFGTIPGIGKLTYLNMYFFYDEPLIFSCVTEDGKPYLFMLLSSAEPDCAIWLAAEISTEMMYQLINKNLPIREVYTDPEAKVWKVRRTGSFFAAEKIFPSTLTEDMLPAPDAFLV